MSIDFTCPSCGSEIEADESSAGSPAPCPKCHGTMLIPLQGMHAGQTVGTYLIERKLGVGGMGEVWLAKHTTMQREVALKILSPAMTADPEFVTSFMHEVQTAAKLEHPNVVTAFDAGQAGTIHYLAVSYVDGEEVGKRLAREHAIPEAEALRIVRGVAEALAYAWNTFQMIHRDIKPANIMLTSNGTPKLMDMGISKSMSENTELTMAGYIVGTPQYMSPEQARGDQDIDFHTDIYELGATLYHMVAGSVPFGGTTMMAVLTRHITDPLESPRKRNPQVSEACAALIESMMAKDVKDRPTSWEDVIRDIGLVMKGRMPASCRPQTGRSVVTRMTPEGLRTLRSGSRLAVSARALQDAVRTPATPPAKAFSAKPVVFVSAALAVAAIIGLTVFLAARTSNSGTTLPAAASVVASPASTPVTSAPPVKEADKTEEMWSYAVKYAAENPQQYQAALGNFRTLKTRAAGTKYEMMADVELKRLEQAQQEHQDKALTKVLDDLQSRAQPLADGQDFAGAAAVYTSYNGVMAKETETERTRLAADFSHRAQQLDETRTKTVDAALAAAVGELLEGKTTEPRSRMDSLAKADVPATERDRVQKAQALLQELCQVDDQVLKSFEAQKGQDVDVTLAGKTQRLKITGIKAGVVQAGRFIGQAMASVEFTPKQLPADERIHRLQGRTSPEVCALYAGLAAHARGDDQIAAKTLADAGALAPALQAALGSAVAAGQQTQKEAAARQALAKVLQPFGVPGDNLTWPVVSTRLDKAKWTEAAVTNTLNALETFRKEYGETKVAAAQHDMLDQMALLLASKVKPATPTGSIQDPRSVAKPINVSPYRPVEALKAALKLANPKYEHEFVVVAENGRIVAVQSEPDRRSITNIAPVRGLPLREVDLYCSGVTDFSPLEGMPLERLTLTGSTFGNDSAPLLLSMPLSYLCLNNTQFTDMRVLKGKRITRLFVKGSGTRIADLEPLRGMPLTVLELSLDDGRAIDLGPLCGMPLERLSLLSGTVKDFAPLSSLLCLKTLDLGSCAFKDLSFLKGKQIEELLFDPKYLTNPGDVQILRKMKSLKQIARTHCQAADFWKAFDAGEFGKP